MVSNAVRYEYYTEAIATSLGSHSNSNSKKYILDFLDQRSGNAQVVVRNQGETQLY